MKKPSGHAKTDRTPETVERVQAESLGNSASSVRRILINCSLCSHVNGSSPTNISGKMYIEKPCTIPQLKAAIRREIKDILREMLQNAMQSSKERLRVRGKDASFSMLFKKK
ncbi:hypothetical protein C0J52_11542 [Blattella germanica]|nr:hypothetical protein C0J52_11542 [Blattella germanica]